MFILYSFVYPEAIKMLKKGGVYYVPVTINDKINLDFVVDSGASDITLPYDVYRTLQRTNSISPGDIIGENTYIMANGQKEKSKVINLKKIKIGNIVINDVQASVSNHMDSMLLLGQSALQKIEPWRLDTKNHKFYIQEHFSETIMKDNLDKVLNEINEKESKNVQKAITRCYNGVSDKCVRAGIMYKEGKYIQQDYTKAVKFFKIACDDNYPIGCQGLAEMYHQGLGVEQNTSRSISLYKKACDDLIVEACHDLGVIYLTGGKVKKNVKKAIKYYDKACRDGSTHTCTALARFYSEGKDVKQDYSKTVKYSKIACERSDYSSCYILGGLYSLGKGVKRNLKKSKSFYTKACDNSIDDACYFLGKIYYLGKGVKKNTKKALQYYEKACNAKVKKSCSKAAAINYSLKEYYKSAKYAEYGCYKDEGISCAILSEQYKVGLGVVKNYSKSEKFREKSCNLGLSELCN